MPRRIFVDTSYVLALFNTADEFHEKANGLKPLTEPPNHIVTTEAVILEIGNAFARQDLRKKGSSFIHGFYNTPNMEVIPITTKLIMDGLNLFDKRGDKEWGLVDCISFVVMTRFRITDALAADDHFIQAGFKALLLDK